MCNNPFLLVVVNNEGTKTYKTFPSEGQAEVEGMKMLEDTSVAISDNFSEIGVYYVSFSIYSIVSSFQKVTKIERVSLAPTKED